jgi:outer membrane lipoprotein-sorting protein
MRGRFALLALSALAMLNLLAIGAAHGTPYVLNAQTPSPVELATALQKRYATIKDFRADFTHEVRGAVLRTIPQKKDFVADGTSIYTYIAADRSGTQRPMPTGSDMSIAILFVAGQGDLVKDFRATMPASQPADVWHLTLTPIKRQEDFATMTLVVDRRTLMLRGLNTVDHSGGTFVFAFTNIRENVGLKDSDFQYRFPRNANIIRTGSSSK